MSSSHSSVEFSSLFKSDMLLVFVFVLRGSEDLLEGERAWVSMSVEEILGLLGALYLQVLTFLSIY